MNKTICISKKFCIFVEIIINTQNMEQTENDSQRAVKEFIRTLEVLEESGLLNVFMSQNQYHITRLNELLNNKK